MLEGIPQMPVLHFQIVIAMNHHESFSAILDQQQLIIDICHWVYHATPIISRHGSLIRLPKHQIALPRNGCHHTFVDENTLPLLLMDTTAFGG